MCAQGCIIMRLWIFIERVYIEFSFIIDFSFLQWNSWLVEKTAVIKKDDQNSKVKIKRQIWNTRDGFFRDNWVVKENEKNTHLRPAIISIAELKFPMFQQVWATRRKQDKIAFCSSIVTPLLITWMTHELTYIDNKTIYSLAFYREINLR